ncbi:MAG: hypothetical protein L6275_04670 [Candidatus Portnoybacteria bacterium]|nr:hypothetical protein [Candidatus Portnoybacteria bacterium]
MERESFERNNPREEFGRKVEVHAKFIRHSEKKFPRSENEVPLSENGIKKSEELGEGLEKRDRIEGEYSDTVRARNTTESVVFHSPTENKLKTKERGELAFRCSDDFMLRTRKHIEEVSKKSQKEIAKKGTEAGASTEGIDYYLSFGDKRPDNETYSPEETAATVAKRLDIAIRKADRLHSGTKMDAIFTSHDYVVAAFLKEVMSKQDEDGKKVEGFTSLEDIGGMIQPLEGFELIAKTDETGQKTIEFNFRGQNYEFNTERFEELVKIASRLEEEDLKKKESKKAEIESGGGLNKILEQELNNKLGRKE